MNEQEATMPRERPMLFSAPMVRAILAGKKTQTRRVFKVPAGCSWYEALGGEREGWLQDDRGPAWWHVDEQRCPYGAPGDRLWVRETWAAPHKYDGHRPRDIPALTRWHYAADEDRGGLLWRPSIHMPRVASRLTLHITGVRVERLQDISRGDAMAEGCPFPNMAQGTDQRGWYEGLWRELHGAQSWAANPWVWVINFGRACLPTTTGNSRGRCCTGC